MPIYLRQSTASQEVPLGYFVDSTDGDTEKTALSIANTDIKVWKTGATTLASKNSGGATHISNGVYYCVLDATDTNTIGPLVLFVHVSGALSVRVECCVLDEAVYDALFGTTALATATNITAATGIDVTKVDGASLSTHASGMVPADLRDIAGSAISTSSAQLGVNVVSYASGQAPLQPTVATRTLDVSAGGEAGVDWGNVGSPTTTLNLSGTTIGVVTANSDKTGYRLSSTGVDDILRTALTESYAAKGAAFTLSQALYEICQTLSEFAIASTTITVKKRDGSTTAATFDLDSATAPTSRTRAS